MTYYFVCPKPDGPSGGVWFIHRIVGLLQEMGKEALVIQEEPFDVWWDNNPNYKDFILTNFDKVKPEDVLIVPEVRWLKYAQFPALKSCFLQNHLWSPPLESNVPVIVCSRYLANYVERMWKGSVIGKITPFLDDNLWSRDPSPHEKDKVLLMGRRNEYHASMKTMLEASNFTVDYITKPLSQFELSQHLSEAEYYVHLAHPEGFPMACLEAMCSNTLVVGTTGGGGNEFMFHNETALVVQDPKNGRYDNTDSEFQKRIIEQLTLVRGNEVEKKRIVKTAHRWSLRYTATETKKELAELFK